MKVTYRTPGNKLAIEIDAATVKDLFAHVAEIQSVFEADSSCGVCGETSISYRVRENDGNKYYEWVCRNHACGAKLNFGQYKQGGGLFVKTWDSDNARPYPNRGWRIWRGKDDGGYQNDADDSAPY